MNKEDCVIYGPNKKYFFMHVDYWVGKNRTQNGAFYNLICQKKYVLNVTQKYDLAILLDIWRNVSPQKKSINAKNAESLYEPII